MSRVCVVGLGKLGSVMAAVFADAGHIVVGVDVDATAVGKICQGIAPVDEPGLQGLIDNNRARLVAVMDLHAAVQATDIAFIIVPTPSKDDGFFDHSMVLQAAIEIGEALRYMTKPFTIVISSTVMPGTCGNAIQPAVDGAAHRHIPVIYSPEFIALGSVIHDMRCPDVVLIGADDAHDGVEALVDVISPVVVRRNPEFQLLSLVDAELGKICVNSFVTMKISFANQLAAICEGIVGADARSILKAIGGDSRIGRKYLNPGGPYGGPCFPRDNRAFQAMAQRALTVAPLALAADMVNDEVVRRIISMVPHDEGDNLAILGLTYKPDTSVKDESLGMKLADHFEHSECHDPSFSRWDPQELLDDYPNIIIATAWPEYADLDYSQNEIVVDVWGILPPNKNILRLGHGT